MLEIAKEEVSALIEAPHQNPDHVLRFFKRIDKHVLENNRSKTLSVGLESLNNEIARQKNKIASLEACLPVPSVSP